MKNILIMGAGKIGSLIAFLLAAKDYSVYLADVSFDNRADLEALRQKVPHIECVPLDANDESAISVLIKQHKIQTIVSCLPYYLNKNIVQIAHDLQLNYFDLTEDRRAANHVATLAEGVNHAFVPQCGLAPGFISIVANHLMQDFSTLETAKLRVGALPTNVSNALQYSLTWSTDGLINEYGNDCQAIENGVIVTLPPLASLEEIQFDGLAYEAFNTSGGVGSLIQTYQNKVQQLSYKLFAIQAIVKKCAFL